MIADPQVTDFGRRWPILGGREGRFFALDFAEALGIGDPPFDDVQ